MNRKEERRQEVENIRNDAQIAARNGRHINTCPYRDMDKYQWENAYREELALIEYEQKRHQELIDEAEYEEIKRLITDSTSIEDLKQAMLLLLNKIEQDQKENI